MSAPTGSTDSGPTGTAGLVVGAAIVRAGRVLAAQRSAPADAAGRWEFPGGKVDPGETDTVALVRECREELGVTVAVGERVGPDVPMPNGLTLRLYLATLVEGEPQRLEHAALRWLPAAELGSVDWLPADAPLAAVLSDHLQ